jgi:hypothetical protein
MSWTKRRVCPRASIRLEAAYEDAERQVFLPTRDISEEGIYLFAPDPPEVGSAAKVVLDLPGHPEILRVTGWVTRRDAGDAPGFAVCFDHDDRAQRSSTGRAALRRFVDDTRSSTGEVPSS